MIRLLSVCTLLLLAGCQTSIDRVLHSQATDFVDTVVMPVLLPHYLDTEMDPIKRANISAAVAEHRAALAEWGTP